MGNVVSTVTFTVSHDECTDAFQEFVENTAREYASGDIVMMDYTVQVDVPDPLGDALKSVQSSVKPVDHLAGLSSKGRAKVLAGRPLYACSIL